MADDSASKDTSKQPQDEMNDPEKTGDTKRKRRVLRPAAEPATLRQQSEKAQAQSERPRRGIRFGRIIATPFVFIGRLLARIFKPLGRFKFFRVIGYIFAPPYIRNAWKELKQVTWPNRRQTRRLTFAVIVFSLIFGSIVALVDWGLDKIFRALILN